MVSNLKTHFSGIKHFLNSTINWVDWLCPIKFNNSFNSCQTETETVISTVPRLTGFYQHPLSSNTFRYTHESEPLSLPYLHLLFGFHIYFYNMIDSERAKPKGNKTSKLIWQYDTQMRIKKKERKDVRTWNVQVWGSTQ